MARKVVLDSAPMPDAEGRAPAAGGRVRRGGVVLGDLAWTRLTRWREMLSQVFENRERLAQLAADRRVRVSYGAGVRDRARWYLAAWIADALARRRGTRRRGRAREDVPTLRVELEGEGLRVDLSRHDETLVVTVNDARNYTSLPQPTDYLLMREELGIVRRDPVFERTLASAARLAYPTDK